MTLESTAPPLPPTNATLNDLETCDVIEMCDPTQLEALFTQIPAPTEGTDSAPDYSTSTPTEGTDLSPNYSKPSGIPTDETAPTKATNDDDARTFDFQKDTQPS